MLPAAFINHWGDTPRALLGFTAHWLLLSSTSGDEFPAVLGFTAVWLLLLSPSGAGP
jgi:hypothetical protein